MTEEYLSGVSKLFIAGGLIAVMLAKDSDSYSGQVPANEIGLPVVTTSGRSPITIMNKICEKLYIQVIGISQIRLVRAPHPTDLWYIPYGASQAFSQVCTTHREAIGFNS